MERASPGRQPLLRDYQARTFLALSRGLRERPGETQTVLFSRQAGKNEVAAALVASLLITNARRGGSVIVCAPTFSPQAEISLRRTLAALRHCGRLLPAAGTVRAEGAVLRVGRAEAFFLSASPEAHVAGHTASLALIADEAQEIDAEWFDRQFRPMAASTGAPTVLFGTPWDGETLLDRAVARNRERDAGENAGPRLHHETAWEAVARAVPAYGRYVAQERERLGARHPLFVTQYGLECVADAGRLFTRDDLDAFEGEHARETGPAPGFRYVAGLDLGGEGSRSDASVLTVARVRDRRCEVVDLRAWHGDALAEVQREATAAIQHWGIERLCVDSTGLGQSLAKELAREFGNRAEAVTFSAAVKSELGYGLLAGARSRRLSLFADSASTEARALRAELAACRATYNSGQLRWGAPSGGHDDFAVSLALCFRAAESLGPERVAVGRRR